MVCTGMVYGQYTMPSPRFSRLSPERRARILGVARQHLARGAGSSSYNRIIADAGISKTTAYLYFDGKDDLVAEVWRDLAARLSEVIGPWRPVSSPAAFWAQLGETSDALHRHLMDHPDDLALLGQGAGDAEHAEGQAWFTAMLDDGTANGVIRDDIDRPLLLAATRAVFRVADAYVLAGLLGGQPVDPDSAWQLLRGLWSTPDLDQEYRQ